MIDYKVSVIVPIYNVERYVERCVDSIISQSYKNLEIILVNDGSTDNSFNVIQKYATDNRCIIINKENGGLSSARNVGLNNATGEFVYFIDSDDHIALNAIELLLGKILQTNADFCCYRIAFFLEGSDDYSVHGTKFEYDLLEDKNSILKDAMLSRNIKTSAWSKFFSRDFLVKNELSFEYGIINEDCLFSIQCGVFAQRVAFLNEVLYFALMRPTSISRDIKSKNLTDYFIIYAKIKKLLRNRGTFDLYKDYFYASYTKNILFTLILSSYRLVEYKTFKQFIIPLYTQDYYNEQQLCGNIKVISLQNKILYRVSLYPKIFYFFIKTLKFLGLKLY